MLTDFLSLFVNLKYFTIMIGKEKDVFFKYGAYFYAIFYLRLGVLMEIKNLHTQICIL
jgi:hypothetical protein